MTSAKVWTPFKTRKKVNRLNLSASRTVDRIMMFKMATVEMAELNRAGDPITKFWAIVSETLSRQCATPSPVNYMISKQIAPQFPLLKTVHNAPKLTKTLCSAETHRRSQWYANEFSYFGSLCTTAPDPLVALGTFLCWLSLLSRWLSLRCGMGLYQMVQKGRTYRWKRDQNVQYSSLPLGFQLSSRISLCRQWRYVIIWVMNTCWGRTDSVISLEQYVWIKFSNPRETLVWLKGGKY